MSKTVQIGPTKFKMVQKLFKMCQYCPNLSKIILQNTDLKHRIYHHSLMILVNLVSMIGGMRAVAVSWAGFRSSYFFSAWSQQRSIPKWRGRELLAGHKNWRTWGAGASAGSSSWLLHFCRSPSGPVVGEGMRKKEGFCEKVVLPGHRDINTYLHFL